MVDDRDCSYRLDDYDYRLPSELIAQFPTSTRQGSRLLILDRSRNECKHSRFDQLGSLLNKGDVLIVNDTRVVPARLRGNKESGGKIELLVLDPYKSTETGKTEGYCCLVKTSKGIKAGQTIRFADGIRAWITHPIADGKARVHFDGEIFQILDAIGELPLPPYITRKPETMDQASYQTEYARVPGAVAAPTAGLHFTLDLLNELQASGIEIHAITLHVGYGTFAPIRCRDIREHRIHSEFFEIDGTVAESITRAKCDGRRVIAVGTTVVRTLEWIHSCHGKVTASSGLCNHFIYPGYSFGVVDCMITNFHLPKSSLTLLVSAFAGRSRILDAYREAIEQKYRFFSYGDAMLIL